MSVEEKKVEEAQDAAEVEPRPQETVAKPPVIETPKDLNYEEMLEAYNESFKGIVEGAVVPGTVLKISESHVVVDVGFKSEGRIALSEFRDEEGNLEVKPGDKVDVLLERTEDRHGYVVVSRQKAERMKIWDALEKNYQDQSIITGRVIERVKGGLAVDVGVRAFLPGSQVDVQPTRNLDSWCGRELRMRVIKVNRRRGNIVLSRKAVLEEEHFKLKETTLKELEQGKVVSGIVKNITDYGAFVDLGGIDGLLHITDMSWGRVNHPADLFKVGDEIEVKILKFERLEEKVSLGYKQLTEDPWLTAMERYVKDARVKAKVVSLTDYGAFVELEEGIEGLIHISEMTWNRRIKHPSKLLSVGDEVESVVLDIDATARRISLGMKQTEPNPWDTIEEKYAINSIVTGQVRNLTDFGAFIEVEEGIEGLVHISDLSWTKKIQHPSEVVQKGDEVNAVVLNVDAENQRLSLGIKQLEPDKWEEFFSQHQIGDVVHGKIVRLTSFGVFVELSEGIEGLCHVSELADSHIDNPEDHFEVDQELDVKIIKLTLLERRIGLSVKALTDDAEGEEGWAYKPEVATASIGDIAGDELGQLKTKVKEATEDGNDES
ncbi:MAG: 30S ribosomal protein S1 [Acidobacteria bacterium]|nr:30S ribosomal protein S1 [Acidobacteriota bacterium]MCZ6877672.1 30S ribosomal protein S1 [Acidobacteriota bacterium]